MKQVPHAAVNNPPEDPLRHARFRLRKGLRPGGFGIMLVRQIADELIYNEAGNEAVLIKYL
jgi:anti-sigma regulatory factor (Ser/Thr protein kinase)